MKAQKFDVSLVDWQVAGLKKHAELMEANDALTKEFLALPGMEHPRWDELKQTIDSNHEAMTEIEASLFWALFHGAEAAGLLK